MNHNSSHTLLSAIHFAASRHRDQRRHDAAGTPYINHPLQVALILSGCGGVTSLPILQAAVLPDIGTGI